MVGLFAALVAAALVPTVSATHQASAMVAHIYAPPKSAKWKLPLVNVGVTDTVGTPTIDKPGVPAVVIAAARALNRGGGLHGHPVGVIWCNRLSDPNTSQACAQQFINSHVVAIVGGQDTYDSITQPIYQAANIPLIAVNPVGNNMYSASNVFLPQVPANLIYEALNAYAYYHGYRPLVAAVLDNAGGHTLFNLANGTLNASGVSFNADPTFMSPTTVDFSPYASALDINKPAGVFALTSAQQWLPLLSALKNDGSPMRALFVAPSYTQAQLQSVSTDLQDKVITAQTNPPFNDPRMAQMVRQLKAEEARGDLHVAFDQVSSLDLNGWIGMQVVVAITKGMKDITGPNMISALHSSGPIKVAPWLTWNPSTPGPTGFTNVSNQNLYYIGMKNGQQYLLVNHSVNLNNALKGKF
jgi:ABC-type branched-subunit amino acid transport system substrate-binding protein